MERNLVKQMYESFIAVAQPKNAGPVQVQEVRRAFYGGALAMMSLIRNFPEDTTAINNCINIIHKEFDEFARHLGDGT